MPDNIVLFNEQHEKVIINQKSFCELIKWLIVAYIGVSYDVAHKAVEDKGSFFENLNDVESAGFAGHDWPYFYLAMDIYFSSHEHSIDKFLIRKRPDFPGGLEIYQKIENDILHEHNLKEPITWE